MAKKHAVYYLKDGTRAPSVTTILQMLNKPTLNDWRARVGQKKSEEIKALAGDFGASVHSGIEAVCSEGQLPIYDNPRIMAAITNFKIWADANISEWIAFEKAAYHDTLGYAGTTDAFARLKNGKLALVDFKTSKSIHWEYYLQTIAYAKAERYEDDVIVPGSVECIMIVHLNHDTMTWETVLVNDQHEKYWGVFCSLCYVYPEWKANCG